MIAKAKEGDDRLLRGAPHVAIAVTPAEYGWPEDGAIALTYLELAAHAMGIGCCWGGYLTTAIRSFKGCASISASARTSTSAARR